MLAVMSTAAPSANARSKASTPTAALDEAVTTLAGKAQEFAFTGFTGKVLLQEGIGLAEARRRQASF
jgi:hypothetical protein